MSAEQSFTALQDFITDFNLKDANGVASFNAIVHIFFHGRLRIFERNIQIVTSNGLNTVYMVDDDTSNDAPEMYTPATYEFTYIKKESLRLKSTDDGQMMIVSIFPGQLK